MTVADPANDWRCNAAASKNSIERKPHAEWVYPARRCASRSRAYVSGFVTLSLEALQARPIGLSCVCKRGPRECDARPRHGGDGERFVLNVIHATLADPTTSTNARSGRPTSPLDG